MTLINSTSIPMYNLIIYSDNYSKTSESLWQFSRDQSLKDAALISDFHDANNGDCMLLSCHVRISA